MSKARTAPGWPFSRKREQCGPKAGPKNQRAAELDAAKQILAEVFSVRIEEVEMMIRARCEDGLRGDMWPERLCVE
ncbi:MAG: hypothetical protein HPY61_11820 [Methanotrichaceae archaeon]|nr:hypothetical protein [Methanotrichaceae archaeon]